jgi:hypothetical protein
MKNEVIEYRIVKRYHLFFMRWTYHLYRRRHGRKLLGLIKYQYWSHVCGDGSTTSIPGEWQKLNIVEQIEIPIGGE